MTEGRTRGRGRLYAVVFVLVVAVAGGGYVVLARGDDGTAPAAVELPPSTAKVQRQTLDDTQTEDGELGYGASSTLANRLPGTLTSVPDSGAVIGRGQPVFRVDDKPVTLMYGAMPAYRPLAEGTEGADVWQLEENLSALGYTGFTIDDEYSSATADAVREWQEDLGLDETGVVELGRVVFTPAEIRVETVDASAGQPAAPGQKVLSYTGTAKAVTVELDPSDQRLAQEGAAVQVALPDDRKLAGKIADVSTVIEPASGQGEEPQTKVEVEIAFDDQQAAAGYALASVDVTFTAEKRENVLTVPVAALVALAEGGFGVEVVDGATTRYVPVKTGLFAEGKVEISGDGIAEGMVVGMPK
ncbi:efflux RND transporter periplasmic adaptor subunit [Amycolatopsis thermoflava]|uniref:Multidrug efflux pump subunit AcrA (Membrane-fusion protein) n=1 Tax=Amycolatopsis thermoflava TaxID=84480 RepID=A0A3N2GX22_9PSEU|nr:peptidoglycan-binding protein [Amycolatopsis thermoflava]ROS40485.1 multidrug efflux pump subunit AcrA (membrane-fusion protein) [Amycolatopsis thermoflava]